MSRLLGIIDKGPSMFCLRPGLCAHGIPSTVGPIPKFWMPTNGFTHGIPAFGPPYNLTESGAAIAYPFQRKRGFHVGFPSSVPIRARSQAVGCNGHALRPKMLSTVDYS